MVTLEITRIKKLREEKIPMVAHNYYYMIYARLYNSDKTAFYRIKWIEFFDVFDIQEYFEGEEIPKNADKIFVNEITYNQEFNWSFEDKEKITSLIESCNDSLRRYVGNRW